MKSVENAEVKTTSETIESSGINQKEAKLESKSEIR